MLPTNNLIAERDFSKFDRVAKVANSRNNIQSTKYCEKDDPYIKKFHSKIDKIQK